MRRALELAEQGKGRVSPNPLVGAVVVKEGTVAGEGFHAAWGEAHAEAVALDKAGKIAEGADLYVTLEPCNHKGKTGKCTEKILSSGIRKVILAVHDPNPDVEGGGAEFLKGRGIEVVTGVLEDEARFQNRFYFKSVTQKVPYVILKWAMSLDGYTAAASGDSKWISSEESRKSVHIMRNEVDAVCAGVNTVITDDPLFTCRSVPGGRDPVRIVIDPRLRTPPDARLFSSSSPLVFITKQDASPDRRRSFEEKGAECVEIQENEGTVDLGEMLRSLYARKITSVLVEGGGVTAGYFLKNRLADEAVAFCAPCLIGGGEANPVTGAGIRNMDQRVNIIGIATAHYGHDICIRGKIEYPAEQQEDT